jgi:chemotaxis protein MotB
MVTLLFAFFVVMYASSLQDKKKMEAVAESISQSFIGGDKGGSTQRRQMLIDDLAQTPPQTSPRFMVRRVVTNEELIDELRKTLTQEGFDLVHQDKLQPIQIKIDGRGVVISISAGFLFDEGSTEVKPELLPVLGVIAEVLKAGSRLILVEGHTDNRPVVGNVFYSNWELSALRATSMTRTLIQDFEIDPTRVTASGVAHYRPVASNETESGRNENRRVEIILLNASDASELLEDESVPR